MTFSCENLSTRDENQNPSLCSDFLSINQRESSFFGTFTSLAQIFWLLGFGICVYKSVHFYIIKSNCNFLKVIQYQKYNQTLVQTNCTSRVGLKLILEMRFFSQLKPCVDFAGSYNRHRRAGPPTSIRTRLLISKHFFEQLGKKSTPSST